MPRSLALVLALLGAGVLDPAEAQVYRLVAPDGSVSFTNAPTNPAYERIDAPPPRVAPQTAVPTPSGTDAHAPIASRTSPRALLPDDRAPDLAGRAVAVAPAAPALRSEVRAPRAEARAARGGPLASISPERATLRREVVSPRVEPPASPVEASARPVPVRPPEPPSARAEEAPPGGGSGSVDVPQALAPIIRSAASRHGVPERLVTAIIAVESGFNPRAVSRRGARGLMQLMPGTAAMLGVRNAFDPADNVDGGVRHLRGLLDRLGHNVPLALAAYNAGEQAVAQHRGIPPYPETQDYVTRIMRLVEGGGPGLAASLAATLNGGLRVLGDPRGWSLPSPGPARAEASEIYRSHAADGGPIYSNIPPVAGP